MQASGSVSWIVQTSVLGRCGGGGGGGDSSFSQEKSRFQAFGVVRCSGGSQEKKPRVRKTKEERREMVESFINTYRSSNNGKFPSVNLTHKEVGGSFYIVREIVRDIIQENRVLGPGSMNLKSLSFDDCHDPSKLSIMHEIDEDNVEILNMSDQNQDGEDCGLTTSGSQEAFTPQQNVVTTQQLLGSSNLLEVGFFNNVVQNGNVADAACMVKILGKQNGVPCGNSRVQELDNSNQSVPSLAHVSDSDKEMVLENLGDGHEDTTENIADGANLSSEPSDVFQTSGAFSLPEHEIFPEKATNSNVHHILDDDQFSLALVASETESYNSNTSYLGTKDPSKSSEMSEVQIQLDEFEQQSLTASPERTESMNISSTPNGEEPENSKCLVSPPTLETKGLVEVQDKDSTIEEDEGELKKSISATLKEEHVAGNAKHEHASNTTTAISREKAEKVQQKKETNPFWLSIRALIDAIVKFWTE